MLIKRKLHRKETPRETPAGEERKAERVSEGGKMKSEGDRNGDGQERDNRGKREVMRRYG